jgi:hypothetical protein
MKWIARLRWLGLFLFVAAILLVDLPSAPTPERYAQSQATNTLCLSLAAAGVIVGMIGLVAGGKSTARRAS